MSDKKALPFRQTEDGIQIPGGIIPNTSIRKVYVDPNVTDVEDPVTLVNISFFGIDADFDPMALEEGSDDSEETPETPQDSEPETGEAEGEDSSEEE